MPQRFDRALLLDMLTYRRPSGSATEREFRRRFVLNLPYAIEDTFGNIHVHVGDDATVLWSCHTDTVHRTDGRQSVFFDPKTSIARLSRKSRKRYNCLGADDTIGVFLCRQLILSGVPGHYIFHHAEEIGGVGSYNLAERCPELIRDSRFAIALDRRGTGDIVSHQYGGRCCSGAFIDSLSAELARFGLTYSANHGSFTDTANYTDLIGECTNLSIGYASEHSSKETANLAHVESILYALQRLDQSALVSERQPGESDSDIRYYDWPSVQTVGQPVHGQGPTYYRTTKAVVYEYDCEYCGYSFTQDESDAKEDDTYCSLECEIKDAQEITKRLNRTLYLTPETADVQETLIEDFKRRTAGKVH